MLFFTLLRVAAFISFASASLPQDSSENACSVCKCRGKLIDCSGRSVSALPSLEKGSNATTITFAHCTFSHIQQLPKLSVRFLSFAHNDINNIDDAAFKNLANLQSLDLSYNVLTSDSLLPNVFRGNFAPDQYEPLRSLKELNLAHNQLHTLHHDAFVHLINLEKLKINENPLKIITFGVMTAISSLPFLKELDLSRTSIKAIPEVLLHAPKYLEKLDLSYNFLTVLPLELENSHRLRWLSLDGNPIKRIETSINLPFIKVLYLSKMPELVSIGERALSQMPSLEELYCSNNRKLKKIAKNALSAVHSDEEGETWPLLNVLELSNNSLETIERHLVARWDHLTVVNLQNNPWLCDCESQWLVSTLAPIIEKAKPEMMESFKCYNPIERRGISVQSLAKEDLCSTSKKWTHVRSYAIVGAYACVVIIFVSLLIGFVYYKKAIKTRNHPYHEMSKVKYSHSLYLKNRDQLYLQLECGASMIH